LAVTNHGWVAGLLLFLASCGGGGGEGDQGGCLGDCASAAVFLEIAEVERVVRQAVHEAQARGMPATIAVTDRVGNVLAVFRMTGAAPGATVGSGRGVSGGLENALVPAELAAIAKAMTGAYLSSEGNAFSTRTASQIVQENFNPGETNAPGGPLFGVQFSSLTCSDVVNVDAGVVAGPKGSPLGLAADPGGLPLYKAGTVVGGIGVMADGAYGLDANVLDVDHDAEELIALAGARGFDAPANRRAERISADGRTLRFVDSEVLASDPAAAPAFAALPGVVVAVPGFFAPAAVRAGTAYGTQASGYRADASAAFAGLGVFVLDDGAGVPRFPPIAGTDGLLAQAEVQAILAEAIKVANRARAQIRQPLGSPAQVSVAVVDTAGAILGVVRSRDAPVFGTDVAVQKARSALVFSHPASAADLAALAGIAPYVGATQALIPGALADGTAYSSRSIGNLARPFLPDGINGNPNGPLSKPFAAWSPFSDGLQTDLVVARIVANLPVPAAGACTGLARAANGIQVFPGGFPIFRGSALVGAIGVSGDGVDQDDLVGFLGLHNAGAVLGTGIGNAPAARRASNVAVPGGNLRYAGCPVAPFLDTTASDVCSGI
jgi:uncharacterized protein GlcG (DUF336 family)